MYLVYRDQNIEEMKDYLRKANYFWVGLSLFLGFFSHLFRALRWNLLIHPLGYKPRLKNTFMSIWVMYLANLALPRLGEVSRCGIVKKYEKISFTKLLGTVVVERTIDMLMLVFLFFLTLLLQFDVILKFFPFISQKFSGIFNSAIIYLVFAIIGIGGILLLYIFRHKIKQLSIYQRIRDLFVKFFEGIKTVKRMEKKGLFIFYSFMIWLLYFFMLYVCFFSLEITSNLSMLACLSMLVTGSFGMVAPVQGGIGAWHFMIAQTLVLYGVPFSQGTTFAFIAHTSNTLLLILGGFVSLLLLPLLNNKQISTQENIEEE